MKNENNEPAAAPNALQDYTSCPEWGTGGQFIYDQVTKTRTRVGGAPAPAGAPNALLDEAGVTSTSDAAAVESTAPGAAAEAADVDSSTPSKKERNRA